MQQPRFEFAAKLHFMKNCGYTCVESSISWCNKATGMLTLV